MRRLAVQLAARRLGPNQVCRPASSAAPCVAFDILTSKKSFLKSSKAAFCHRNIFRSFSVGTSVKAFHFETPGQSGNSDVIGETDFDPVAANFISVVGNVGNDPELRFLDNGNKVASWSLAFRDRRDAETEWFNIEAWGSLAERAAAEIHRGNRIAVQGRLKIRSWTSPQGQPRKDIRITANSIKRVRSSSMEGWQGQPNTEKGGSGLGQREDVSIYSKPANDVINNQSLQGSQPQETQQMGLTTNEELWMNFFEDTTGWYDNRSQKASGKINPKSPDFKRREGGRDAPALWIDSRTTPAWVKKELEKLDKIADGMPPF
jgi:single-strand DNA-binding protein